MKAPNTRRYFATLLTLTTIGLAGCAVDTSQEDPTNTTAEAVVLIGDHPITDIVYDERGVGSRGGVTVSGDPQRRMYDFDKTPRIGQRAPYEVNLSALQNALVVPHSGQMDGNEITWHNSTECGVTCTVPP